MSLSLTYFRHTFAGEDCICSGVRGRSHDGCECVRESGRESARECECVCECA